MSCPADDRWDLLLAQELSPFEVQELRGHAAGCVACARQVALVDALTPSAELSGVEALVDRAVSATHPHSSRPDLRWVGLVAALVCAIVALGFALRPRDDLQTRGTGESNWTKRVTAELRPVDAVANPLAPGATLLASTHLAVWYRNAETTQPLFLMAYLVDAHGELHWVAPAYVAQGQEPDPKLLPVSVSEALLAHVVELDGPAEGLATLVTVVSRAPGSVLTVERATLEQRLNPETLLSGALVWRQTVTLTTHSRLE